MSEAVLRIALADDESLARKRLVRLLGELACVKIVLVSESGEALLRDLPDLEVDLLLLDIAMPGLSGLDVRRCLDRDAPYTIYVTAHPQHALEAFDAGAIDYVLKPIDAERLALAIERARMLLSRSATPLSQTPAKRPAKVAIETRDGLLLLAPDRITHASFDGQLVSLHHEGRDVVTDRSLSELEALLLPWGFERVHRRHLLNLHRVERLEDHPSGGYVAHCDDGSTVQVSRQIARQLRRRLLGGS